ncbi:hypothetical protein [Microcella sp.]|uniref:hypothetical protein n=1 Tax=Microcella sp. TaxID=1913979 RepID=UPI003F6FDAFA
MILILAMVAMAAGDVAAAWLAPMLGTSVLLSLFIVLVDLRRRHVTLNSDAAQIRQHLAQASALTTSLAATQRTLSATVTRLEARQSVPPPGLNTMASENRAMLGSVEKGLADIRLSLDADRRALGWVELAKSIALEPQFADGDVDPWAIVEVKNLLKTLPADTTLVVVGGRFTALLCALVGQPTTSVVMLTDDREIADTAESDVRDRGLSHRVEVRLAMLEYGEQRGVAGYAVPRNALDGVAGIALVVVAGPPWASSPQTRHLAISGLTHAMDPICHVVAADPHHPRFPAMIDAWRTQLVGKASVRRRSARHLVLEFTKESR